MKTCDFCQTPHEGKGRFCSEPCRKSMWEIENERPKRNRRTDGLPYRKASADWPARRAAIVAKYCKPRTERE